MFSSRKHLKRWEILVPLKTCVFVSNLHIGNTLRAGFFYIWSKKIYECIKFVYIESGGSLYVVLNALPNMYKLMVKNQLTW